MPFSWADKGKPRRKTPGGAFFKMEISSAPNSGLSARMAFNPQLIILVLMSTSQHVKAQTLIFLYKQIFGDLLKDPSITELAVNRPGEIFFERNGRWEHQAAPGLTYQQVKAFAVNAATFNSQTFEEQSSPVLSAVLPNGEHQFAILRVGVFLCTATNDKQETFIVDSVCFAFLLDIKDLTVHVELAWTNQTSPLRHAIFEDPPACRALANAMGFLLNHGLAMMLPQLNKFRLDLCGIQPFGLTKLIKVVAKDQEPDAPVDQAAQA